MREYYDLYVGDLRSVIPFEKTVKESMYKNPSRTSIWKPLTIRCSTVCLKKWKALRNSERFRDKAVLKYIENYSLSEALREENAWKKWKSPGRRKRKAAEGGSQKEEASRKAVQREETSATVENKEDSKAELPKTTAETQEAENTTEVQEEIWTLDFRVRGTRNRSWI